MPGEPGDPRTRPGERSRRVDGGVCGFGGVAVGRRDGGGFDARAFDAGFGGDGNCAPPSFPAPSGDPPLEGGELAREVIFGTGVCVSLVFVSGTCRSK